MGFGAEFKKNAVESFGSAKESLHELQSNFEKQLKDDVEYFSKSGPGAKEKFVLYRMHRDQFEQEYDANKK